GRGRWSPADDTTRSPPAARRRSRTGSTAPAWSCSSARPIARTRRSRSCTYRSWRSSWPRSTAPDSTAARHAWTAAIGRPMVPAVGVGAGEAATSRGLRAPLRHRDFRYLAGGLATSQVGEWLASLALIVFVLEETGSAGWVAAAGTARLIPYVTLGPIGGTIADRLPRLKVMIASDLARVLSSGALAWVVASTGSALAAIVLSTLTACFSVAHAPCVVAAIPRIVREDELAAANAITTTITNAAIAIGPALGGLFLVLGSPA